MRGTVIHIQTIGSRDGGVRGVLAPEERCGVSGKRKYLTQQDAEEQIAEWQGHNTWSGECYSYRCPCCPYWHITRRAPR